ncbi:MAG: hypothetical protein Q9162_002078 [Coniocarpon cinnabarinum]
MSPSEPSAEQELSKIEQLKSKDEKRASTIKDIGISQTGVKIRMSVEDILAENGPDTEGWNHDGLAAAAVEETDKFVREHTGEKPHSAKIMHPQQHHFLLNMLNSSDKSIKIIKVSRKKVTGSRDGILHGRISKPNLHLSALKPTSGSPTSSEPPGEEHKWFAKLRGGGSAKQSAV